ncbi:MAG: hypothetical protein E7635_06720 [Ruminococcaceae bacterium]|nr:hypothetical protein [Oscillospiraceae bacterium]
MATGNLIVRVSTAGGTIPLEGALVTVYAADGGDSSIIATRTTDSSGRTDKIVLETPPKELSETPDNGGVRPYAIYNIEVKSDGYYDAFNLELPVFDSITSILPVNMIPLSKYNSEETEPNIGIDVTDREPPLSNGGDV